MGSRRRRRVGGFRVLERAGMVRVATLPRSRAHHTDLDRTLRRHHARQPWICRGSAARRGGASGSASSGHPDGRGTRASSSKATPIPIGMVVREIESARVLPRTDSRQEAPPGATTLTLVPAETRHAHDVPRPWAPSQDRLTVVHASLVLPCFRDNP